MQEEQGLLSLAEEGARRAGALLLERFRGPASGVGSKSTHTDLASDADRDAEALLTGFIRAQRPQDGFLAEEGGETGPRGELRWVLDPLDGTINFLFGLPSWCVAIAAVDPGGTVLGVIHNPLMDETFTATRGNGARLDGRPIRVSDRSELSSALVATGFSYDAGRRRDQGLTVGRLLPRVRDIRRAGSASLDFASLACGRVDAYYEGPLAPWDRLAGALIASEAGAVVTELPIGDGDETVVVAANPVLHPQLQQILLEA